MINSFGTGKPTEADGSGRRRSGSSPAKVRCSSSPAAAPRKAHWRAQRSPTPKKQLFCCAAVLLSFVGPAYGRAGFGIAAAATAAAPRKAHWRAQRSPTCRELLFSLFVFVLCAIYY